jgi:hypothetical protein
MLMDDYSKKQEMALIYYPVSVLKLFILSLCSFGIYMFYVWFQNFEYIRVRNNSTKSSFWRSFWMIVTVFSLFSHVDRTARKKIGHGVPGCYFFATWFFLSLLSVILGFFFMGHASVSQNIWLLIINHSGLLALIPLQLTINNINKKEGMGRYINRRFTLKNVLVVLLGVCLWVLMIDATISITKISNNPQILNNLIQEYQLTLPQK